MAKIIPKNPTVIGTKPMLAPKLVLGTIIPITIRVIEEMYTGILALL